MLEIITFQTRKQYNGEECVADAACPKKNIKVHCRLPSIGIIAYRTKMRDYAQFSILMWGRDVQETIVIVYQKKRKLLCTQKNTCHVIYVTESLSIHRNTSLARQRLARPIFRTFTKTRRPNQEAPFRSSRIQSSEHPSLIVDRIAY